MMRIKEFFKRTRSFTPRDLSLPPWFDMPNAMELLETRRKFEKLSDFEFESLRRWAAEGYIVLGDLVCLKDTKGMLQDLNGLWTAMDPVPSLVIEELKLRPEDPAGLPHSKLVTLDQNARNKLKREQRWRIHGFYRFSKAAQRIFDNPALKRWASLILGRDADPFYTINFSYGSTQTLHQDTAVFYVWPANFLVGAWLACEDIHPDSGPLIYYSGSHKEKLFSGFDEYPRVNLKNCKRDRIEVYQRYLEELAKKYEKKTFLAKQGETFLWHGMLIHGGDAIRNPALTRHSYVCHYIPRGCDKSSEAQGPFNW